MTLPRKVYLLREALEALAALEWGDLETSGGLYGHLDHAGERLVISEIIGNSSSPYASDRTTADFDYFIRFDRDGRRLVGDIHNHPRAVESAIAPSEADRAGWRSAARALDGVYWGMIAAPDGVRWQRDFAISDWSKPRLAAWVVAPGQAMRQLEVRYQRDWIALAHPIW